MRTLGLLALALVACSSNETIHADPTSAGPAGSGGSRPGSTSATTGAGGASTTSAGTGASCCGPLQIDGTVKTVSAELDPAQRVVGPAPQGGSGAIAVGPFFLTDALGVNGAWSVWLSPNGDCASGPNAANATLLFNSSGNVAQGMHLFAPAGVTMCMGQGVSFAGFRPY